jgi:hypothetical protein
MEEEAKVEVEMEEEAKVEVCGERGGAEEVEMEGAKEPARRARGYASPRDSRVCLFAVSKQIAYVSECLSLEGGRLLVGSLVGVQINCSRPLPPPRPGSLH